MMNVRTDLAVEAKEIYEIENKSKNLGSIPGVEIKEHLENDIKVTDVKILNEAGEKALNKMIGRYITIDIPSFTHYDSGTMEAVSVVISSALSEIIKIKPHMTTLVVGLGNWNVTPDALGPKVISNIMITRHLRQLIPDRIDERIRPVCAISPGVMGITGIETGEIIRGVVEKTKPDFIICIDALASRKMDRVNSTIQIGNTGISPGSGVGNKRMELSEKTLGVPVIAIGVPTVVDAATITNDTIDMLIDELAKQTKNGSEFYHMLKDIDKKEKQSLIEEILRPYPGNLMVTPKEIDTMMDSVSKIIATGINLALQPELDMEDIKQYVN